MTAGSFSAYQEQFGSGGGYDFAVGSVTTLRVCRYLNDIRTWGTDVPIPTNPHVMMPTGAPFYAETDALDISPRGLLITGAFGKFWEPGENEAHCYADLTFQSVREGLDEISRMLNIPIKDLHLDLGTPKMTETSINQRTGVVSNVKTNISVASFNLQVRTEKIAAAGFMIPRGESTRAYVPINRLQPDATMVMSGTIVLDDTGSPLISSKLSPTSVRVAALHSKADFDQCRCGFYSYYDSNALFNDPQCGLYGSVYGEYLTDNRIVATTENYGHTVLGTRGVRSLRSKIVAFSMPFERRDQYMAMSDTSIMFIEARRRVFERLSDQYDVPTYTDVQSMTRAHPLTGPPKEEE